jgi:hypothetical protein
LAINSIKGVLFFFHFAPKFSLEIDAFSSAVCHHDHAKDVPLNVYSVLRSSGIILQTQGVMGSYTYGRDADFEQNLFFDVLALSGQPQSENEQCQHIYSHQ